MARTLNQTLLQIAYQLFHRPDTLIEQVQPISVKEASSEHFINHSDRICIAQDCYKLVPWKQTIYTGCRSTEDWGFKLCTIVHKCLHGIVPAYLTKACIPISKVPGRSQLCSVAYGEPLVPRSKREIFGTSSVCVSGPKTWNELLLNVREYELTFGQFVTRLKKDYLIEPGKNYQCLHDIYL